MANNLKGITIEFEGKTDGLLDALKDVEKKSKSLSSELGDINRLLKMDPKNTELLAQKQKILSEAVENTSEKLATLKDAEKQVQEQFKKGKVSEEQVRALQREIIATEKKLQGYERAVEETAEAVENLGKESDDAADDQEKLAKSVKKAGDAAEDADGGFTIMKGALADLVSSAVQGAISAIGNLVGSLMDLSEATEEYRTMQAKLSGSAETFGYSVEFANSQYEKFYRYLGDDQMATNAITNLMGIGAETDTISKIAEGATAVWATYGDSIPIESLTESINETITVGKVTGTMADSINWAKDANVQLKQALSGNKEAQTAFNTAIAEGLPVEDAFNEALAKITDSQERADVIAKFLNSTYGESKQAYDEMTGSVQDANTAELALKDTQAKLGEAVAPVNTALTNLKDQALVAITPLVQTLADAFMNLYNWMQEHPGAAKTLTAVVIALTAALGVLATVLAIQGLITGVAKAFALLNATLLANPIVLIIAAVAALVAAFIYLWNNCESFRNFWIKLWNGIKAAASAVAEWLKTAAQAIGNAFVNAWEGIKNAWAGVKSFFSNIWNAIKSVFNFNEIRNIGKNLISGLWKGINDKITWLKNKIKGFTSSVLDSIKNFFGVHSPSKETAWIGDMLDQGLAKGVMDNAKAPIRAMQQVSGGVLDAAAGNVGGIGFERQLATRSSPVGAAVGMVSDTSSIAAKLDGIYERLGRLQIVLDTGTLVGETLDKIDAGLATNQLLRARGV